MNPANGSSRIDAGTVSASPTKDRRYSTWKNIMKLLRALLALTAVVAAAPVTAQVPYMDQHVWQITGFPNVGIVIGARATLVVDTGLGPRNGATVARVAARLAPNNSKLFLTTTHFHPEHVAGEPGFPTGVVIIRNTAQQRELERYGPAMVDLFKGISPQFRTLLEGAGTRQPDITFDRDLTVDLGGGVTVRLAWFGAAHTEGDMLIFVEPDRTLISGDVVQNKTGPAIPAEGGTAASWIAVVDEAAKLGAVHVLPDHSPPGDGSLVQQERSFLVELRGRALELKKQGKTADQAGEQTTIEFKKKYPDWRIDDLSGFVKGAFAE